MKYKRIVFFIVSLVIVGLSFTACNKKEEKVLCGAESVVGSDSDSQIATVDVPANAGITKIYVSMTQKAGAGDSIDGGTIVITNIAQTTTSFLYSFSKDPNQRTGNYETTFIQPLCVGPDGASVSINALQGTFGQIADRIQVTVVYCPDYCEDH